MAKLNVDQTSILELLSDKKADFLIPDYQRPYAWNEEQCQTLWDDLFLFSFPDNNKDAFDDNEEYFLGSIVTYKNDKSQSEVIDGQQRLTTLMLILRAFFDKFANMQDKPSVLTRKRIEQCIWKTDAFGEAQKDTLKIDSEVATDSDKEEFLDLLRTGVVNIRSKSQYVLNYQFFQKKIDEFAQDYPSYFPYFPARILGNCILLPIEAESQDTALRIFSTLNDRGLPLSDADIFKAQFYKYYGSLGKKDEFIVEWKELEEISSAVFDSSMGTPMDELFTRYMYFLRAKERNKSSTTESLRKFYEKNKYQYLKRTETIEDLRSLVLFWQGVVSQDRSQFSETTLKKLFILKYAPNGMWQNITSVYFLQFQDSEGRLEENKFCKFLDKITAFIFAYAVTNPGVNALRTPIYDEMVSIIDGVDISFGKYKFNSVKARSFFNNFVFTNQRNITRSVITWYAYTFSGQELLNIKENFHLEHIYPKKRQEMDGSLESRAVLEMLGNKVLLEASINIKASDYRFEDKKKIYSGEIRRGKNKAPSKIAEIAQLSNLNSFDQPEILTRTQTIIDKFLSFLGSQDLLDD